MKSNIRSQELTPTVGKLIYSAITSLDGYIEDEDGNFGALLTYPWVGHAAS
jgi:hypothetical protein